MAGYMAGNTGLDEVWFVVSPKNPLKEEHELLDEHHRLAMVNLAIRGDARLCACDVEFEMPQPSYTIDTLELLEKKHPGREFVLIAGTDIFPSFHLWKDYRQLLARYRFYIYNRPHYDAGEYKDRPGITFFRAPLLDISASFIRDSIKQGKDVSHMLPPRVWEYIRENSLYGI